MIKVKFQSKEIASKFKLQTGGVQYNDCVVVSNSEIAIKYMVMLQGYTIALPEHERIIL